LPSSRFVVGSAAGSLAVGLTTTVFSVVSCTGSSWISAGVLGLISYSTDINLT
jgi:hypothetical protein